MTEDNLSILLLRGRYYTGSRVCLLLGKGVGGWRCEGMSDRRYPFDTAAEGEITHGQGCVCC